MAGRGRLRGITAAFLVSLAAAACTFTDDLSGQIRRQSRSIETAMDQALLLDIIRSGYGAPISFTQVSSVLGTGSITGNIGLPFATFGPGTAPLTLTKNGFGIIGNNSVTASSGNNVQLSVLDNKEFWLGMLTPLSFDTLNFFIRQGIPREILFYLYINKQESILGNKVTTLVNDPNDPSFPAFAQQLQENLALGLTTQTVARVAEVGPPLRAVQASSLKDLVELGKAGLGLRPLKSPQGTLYQVVKGQQVSVLCFDPAIATRKIDGLIPGEYTCPVLEQASGAAAAQSVASGAGAAPFGFKAGAGNGQGSASYRIYPRSTYDIIRYLGLVALADVNKHKYLALTTPRALAAGADPIATSLFVVERNPPAGSFVSVEFQGIRYGIPRNAATTIRIMTLLRQLIALSTSVNTLPVTGTVITAR